MSARYAKVLVAVASLATAFAPAVAGAQTFEQNQQKRNYGGGGQVPNAGQNPYANARPNYGHQNYGHQNYGHNGYQNHGPNGYHPHPQYGGGGHYYGGGGQGFNPALGIMMGVAGAALAAGAAGAAADCIRYQPVYDDWGNYLGRQQVNVC